MVDHYRSRSYGDRQVGATGGDPGIQHARSYSTSHTYSSQPNSKNTRRRKTTSGYGSSLKRGGSWSLSDPEVQRKKRIAVYKAYAVEGKMKGSFRKSFRWIKDKWSHLVYGSWW